MKKTAILYLCIFSCMASYAQTRFSQFYSSPLLINPANTGRFDDSYRIGGAFRRELNAQNYIFTQSHFYADIKILSSKLAENESLAIGVSGLNEQGKSEGITNNYLTTSLAFQKGLDEEGKQQIAIGFQGSFVRNRLEKPTYVFEDQLISWLNAGYSNINPFVLQNVNINYAELSAGLIFQGKANSKNYFTLGFSLQHINRPKKVFQGGELEIVPDYWGHLGWESILDNGKLYGAIISKFTNGTLQDFNSGLNYEINVKKGAQILVGGWIRKNTIRGSAVIPSLGLNLNHFKIAMSYDISISSGIRNLKSASEVSLVYSNGKSRKSVSENKFIKF